MAKDKKSSAEDDKKKKRSKEGEGSGKRKKGDRPKKKKELKPVEKGQKPVESDNTTTSYTTASVDRTIMDRTIADRSERLVGRDPDQSNPKQLDAIRHFVKGILDKKVEGLLEEFKELKGYNLDPWPIDAFNANTDRNRYKDIFCVDSTRVVLKDGNGTDYIHANFVRGDPFPNSYICTQGPLDTTIVDFWRMVLQEEVGYIVMLCDFIEIGKLKCARIPSIQFPEELNKPQIWKAGNMSIRVSVTKFDNVSEPLFDYRTLVLEATGKPSRIVHHFQWRNWPDRGVPESTMAVMNVLRQIRATKYTAVIHCSAGVGRTGTLVAIEWMLQTLLQGKAGDMKEMLKQMRHMRAHAIQTNMQYVYVAQAIYRQLCKLDPTPDNIASYRAFSEEMRQAHVLLACTPNGGGELPLPPPPPRVEEVNKVAGK